MEENQNNSLTEILQNINTNLDIIAGYLERKEKKEKAKQIKERKESRKSKKNVSNQKFIKETTRNQGNSQSNKTNN